MATYHQRPHAAAETCASLDCSICCLPPC